MTWVDQNKVGLDKPEEAKNAVISWFFQVRVCANAFFLLCVCLSAASYGCRARISLATGRELSLGHLEDVGLLRCQGRLRAPQRDHHHGLCDPQDHAVRSSSAHHHHHTTITPPPPRLLCSPQTSVAHLPAFLRVCVWRGVCSWPKGTGPVIQHMIDRIHALGGEVILNARVRACCCTPRFHPPLCAFVVVCACGTLVLLLVLLCVVGSIS